jgi:hypothetical protein
MLKQLVEASYERLLDDVPEPSRAYPANKRNNICTD